MPTASCEARSECESPRPEGRLMVKKTLSKRLRAPDETPPVRDEPGESLLDRAREIAARGMFKEALLLWERSIRQGTDAPIHPATPLVWMINARQYPKGVRHFMTHEAVLRYDHPGLWSLTRELFAVVCLTADPESRQLPPWNLFPWQQSQAILAAMAALQRREDLTVRTQLAGIDVDSPFYPCRRILESLLIPESAPEKILALLEEIPDISPYAPLAVAARARALPPRERVAEMISMPTEERSAAARLCGAQEKWLRLLAKLERATQPARLLGLLLDQGELLPRPHLRQACIQLLPECLEERITFEKRFGPLEEFERERMFALHHERQRSLAKAIGYWRKCALLLENGPDTPEKRLKTALILRRMAHLEQKESHPSTPQILQYLEKSLEYDPELQSVWLEMLQIRNRLGRERTAFHRLADQAARRFPENQEILTLAMAAAMEKGSFKKASGMARRIQKLNPENTEILASRLSAHLQHARKRISEGQFAVARRELLRAERLRTEESQPLGLLTAMLEFLAGDPERGEEILEEGRRQASCKALHAVKAFLEASALRVPALILDGFRRDLIRADALPASQEELVMIAGVVVRAYPQQSESVTEAVTLLSGYFRDGSKLPLDLSESRLLCEALTLTQRYTLLALYGRGAEKRWPEETVFTAYRVRGACENQPWRLTDEDFQRLLSAGEALQEQDPATAAMIQGLLAIPSSRRPLEPLQGVRLSPARIPKPLENKLLKELRARIREEVRPEHDEATLRETRNRLLETLAPTEFGQRGPAVLGYLLDRAFRLKPHRHDTPLRPLPTPRQLEMDLLSE
ncbi:MAG: hypothetical protein HQL95_06620 [Magnetococcales bacterium]|nr:hypothetical protein [Magnetococcales bacterium]